MLRLIATQPAWNQLRASRLYISIRMRRSLPGGLAKPGRPQRFPVLPRVGWQCHGRPEQVTLLVICDVELTLRARHWIELDKAVFQGLAVIHQAANGGDATP